MPLNYTIQVVDDSDGSVMAQASGEVSEGGKDTADVVVENPSPQASVSLSN